MYHVTYTKCEMFDLCCCR